MRFPAAFYTLTTLFYPVLAAGQQAPSPAQDHVPIYSVTVVERTVKAINYEYRTGPTKIDFRGTVLMPSGKGEATVEGQRGRTEIDAKFENVAPPTHYGREYLTYSLWAITPEGAPHNLGELVVDGSNKAHLHVTTGLQAFGLIVTAEPYSTTRTPSDVVVLENEVRPDTIGTIQPIQAKYELMPRGHYTWQVPDKMQTAEAGLPKVSMDKYEALLELYEAQNAVGVAQAAGAATYAASTFQEAQKLLQQAQQLQNSKSPSNLVVQNARAATQTAEDARTIADRRREQERVTAAEKAAADAQANAANQVRQAQIEADAARAQAAEDRAALERAQAEMAAQRNRGADRAETAVTRQLTAPAPPAPVPAPVPQAAAPARADSQKTEVRMRLFDQLNGILLTRDTPRGLDVTIGDSDFSGTALRDSAASQVTRLGAILQQHPGLRVDVEGFTDEPSTAPYTWKRAQAVQRILLEQGLPAERVTARGMGDSRPLVSNSSPAGRAENRRVEIVISGEEIGSLPFWDRTYSLVPSAK